MEKETKQWIDAGLILQRDPLAIVACPSCENGKLIVKDEAIKGTNKIDRYLICDNCGKWNVITIVPSSNTFPA
jgi:uncharacterized protein YbaR (Trm112 family)